MRRAQPAPDPGPGPRPAPADGAPGPAAEQLPPQGRAALRAGVVGNWVDNLHVFAPLMALAPALPELAGPGRELGAGALIVVAMLLGRPVGGVLLGRVSDRLGRTRTTRLAIAGTAACSLLIAVLPGHQVLGAGTMAAILVLRLAGGVFVAGEYSAAIPLAMEWSPGGRRGLMSGAILSMAPLAQATIAFATAGLLSLLGPQAYAAWGWRLVFAAGGLASLSMLAYYSHRVVDAPIFHRQRAQAGPGSQPGPEWSGEPAQPGRGRGRSARPGPSDRGRLRALLHGPWAPRFWQCMVLMTGLWCLTVAAVLLLSARLPALTGLSAAEVSVAMGIASVAQAAAMAWAGHLSTLVGRRCLLMAWGAVAGAVGPAAWWWAAGATTPAQAAVAAGLTQVATVSAYGPVAAYLSERFPTPVRSTGYGSAYSLSLIGPSLYPFYLPALEARAGEGVTITGLMALGGALVILGARLGPALSGEQIRDDLDRAALGEDRAGPRCASSDRGGISQWRDGAALATAGCRERTEDAPQAPQDRRAGGGPVESGRTGRAEPL
ncbi:MFS transporter [Actinomyces capricornis]|uniref:MFS transporter n=1 Tax=Actinomyces capricornis TaxID=2755559 RepID=A0ABM7UDM9_9ACTO|nr:MFS transporter [Actinomyces capricornis]BDA63383.1 MFS transporter [Actinomyces capricornis]